MTTEFGESPTGLSQDSVLRKGVGDQRFAEHEQQLRNPYFSRRFCPAMGRRHRLAPFPCARFGERSF